MTGADAETVARSPVRPNLFIVGAPKAGTTALGHYLGTHPDVRVAEKELHFFGSDLDFRNARGEPMRRISAAAYLGWFAGCAERRWRCDRSVFYLFSTRAAGEIDQVAPGSRAVALVRNPVEQMHSQHSEMVFQGEEDITDFGAALEAEDARAAGERIPPGCQKPFGLLYRRIATYSPQLERLLGVFGPERTHVVVYDDLRADPATTYRRLLEFLDVEPDHRPEFSVVNANKTVRSTALRDLLGGAPAGLRRAARLVVPGEQRRAAVRRRLQAANTKVAPRPSLDPGLRRRLVDACAPDVAALAALLDRDLGRWLHDAPVR